MRRPGEDKFLPGSAREEYVVFDFFAVQLFELVPEDRIAKASLVTDAGGEGNVSIIQVRRTPGKGPSVKGYDQDFVAVVFRTVQKLRPVSRSY